MTAADRHVPDAHAAERKTIVRVLGEHFPAMLDGGCRCGWRWEHVPVGSRLGPRILDAYNAHVVTALLAAGVRGPEAVARIEGERCPHRGEEHVRLSTAEKYRQRAERAEARLAAVERLAEEWDSTVYKLPPGYPMAVNEFCRRWFKAPLRVALTRPE